MNGTRFQHGHLYAAFGSFHVKFYQTEVVDGSLVRRRRSKRLCAIDKEHYSIKAKPVKLLFAEFMRMVNASTVTEQNMQVSRFWELVYLPYCEEIVKMTGKARKKPSTLRGYKQIWNQHLASHFGKLTLQEYDVQRGDLFLQSLTATQGKVTIMHVKACASALFKHAKRVQRIKSNPWDDVQMPDDAVESARTEHYTLEEAENIVSALVDHVDCQVVMALACFLGLRRGEIAPVRWEDFDTEFVHVRRAMDKYGNIDVPKTEESIASLPLVSAVRVPLELWRHKCSNPKEGWVFNSRNDTAVNLNNLIARVIRPHVEGKVECERCSKIPKPSTVRWKGVHAGRRGAITNIIEATNGNYAVGQALARHKSMTTTLNVYKKQITPQAFSDGMKLYEAKMLKK
jgi:integrase